MVLLAYISRGISFIEIAKHANFKFTSFIEKIYFQVKSIKFFGEDSDWLELWITFITILGWLLATTALEWNLQTSCIIRMYICTTEQPY